nr:MAG TPA: hypothetical protein [Caudoviricetes sp.]
MELLICQFNTNILKAFLRCIYAVRLYFFLYFKKHYFTSNIVSECRVA